MNAKSKSWALLFLATAIFSLLLLASSLSTVETGDSRPIVQIQPQADDAADEEVVAEDEGRFALEGIRRGFTFVLSAIAVAGGAYLVWRISKLPAPRQRRRGYGVFSFLILLAVLYLITNGFEGFDFDQQGVRPIFLVGAPTLAFAFAVGLVPLAIIGGYLFLVWRRNHLSALDQLAREATDTVAEVEAGADIRNAVISCYHRMCQVLQEERRMVRQEGMTPREFADRLEGAGLPHTEVINLTKLFEAVRYGAHEFSPEEEAQALNCLRAISESAKNFQPPSRNAPWSARSAHQRS